MVTRSYLLGHVTLQFAVTLVLAGFAFGQELPTLRIDMGSITTSGVSAGGAFAIQFHVAYSKSIKGVGAFAAPPYYCANNDIEVAVGACMKDPSLIDVSELISATNYAAATAKSIDDPSNMANSRVWIWTGTGDTVVDPGVVDKTQQYYENWVPSLDRIFHGTYPAEHAWITDSCCNPCGYLGSPFINNCGFDAAGFMLNFLYEDKLVNRTMSHNSTLVKFSQAAYTPAGIAPSAISLSDFGFAYIPTACYSKSATCLLHVAFHGCLQNYDSVGESFVLYSGLNEWAEANNIVILYPQTINSPVLPYNPKGCFDWWGYSGADYACKFGPQMTTVQNMLTALTGSFGV